MLISVLVFDGARKTIFISSVAGIIMVHRKLLIDFLTDSADRETYCTQVPLNDYIKRLLCRDQYIMEVTDKKLTMVVLLL